MASNEGFWKEREEFIAIRPIIYQNINAAYSEGDMERAHRGEKELLQNEERFGLSYDKRLYDPIIIVRVMLDCRGNVKGLKKHRY